MTVWYFSLLKKRSKNCYSRGNSIVNDEYIIHSDHDMLSVALFSEKEWLDLNKRRKSASSESATVCCNLF